MRVSFVIITHNRRDTLLDTLARLSREPGVVAGWAEVCVIDNASTDGTAKAIRAVAKDYPFLRLLVQPSNQGSPARNIGVQAARGEFIVLLDDDSYPIGDTVARSVKFLDEHPRAALVGGRVLLPDGTEDAAAYPAIQPACAMCLRRSAFLEIGGFAPEFFRQAEEYDLIFRLLQNSWTVHRYEDLTYGHDKVRSGRDAAMIHRLDVCNNLLLVDRYIPKPLRRAYRSDWLRRYAAMGFGMKLNDATREGVREARQLIAQAKGKRTPLEPHLIESIFRLEQQAQAVAKWARDGGINTVILAGVAKNLYATWRAAKLAGLHVQAIAEGNPAFIGVNYRGIPIVDFRHAAAMRPDGVILAEINPARVASCAAALRDQFVCSVLELWKPQFLAPPLKGARRAKAASISA